MKQEKNEKKPIIFHNQNLTFSCKNMSFIWGFLAINDLFHQSDSSQTRIFPPRSAAGGNLQKNTRYVPSLKTLKEERLIKHDLQEGHWIKYMKHRKKKNISKDIALSCSKMALFTSRSINRR